MKDDHTGFSLARIAMDIKTWLSSLSSLFLLLGLVFGSTQMTLT